MKELEHALKNSWDKDTCWPGCVDGWSEKNPAWGQCAVTALTVDDYLENGKIAFSTVHMPDGSTAPHYYNLIDGEKKDFTQEQFSEGTRVEFLKVVNREEILSLPDREAERYQILKERVDDYLSLF